MTAAPLTTDLECLLEAVLAAPDDYAPRGVLADFLEERGDQRYNTVRWAPDAATAMVGFPDVAARWAMVIPWDKSLPSDVEGRIGCFLVSNIEVGDWPRLVARFGARAGLGLILDEVRVETTGPPVIVGLFTDGRRILDTVCGPNGVWQTPLGYGPVREGVDVVASGPGTFSVRLSARSNLLPD